MFESSLTAYQSGQANPAGDSYQRELYAIEQQEYEEYYARTHQPPKVCEYCQYHTSQACGSLCTLTRPMVKKRDHETCEMYEWNGEPEDEEEREMRLHPERFKWWDDDDKENEYD